MNSDKPPYDVAVSKHGIPTDKTFQISPRDFLWLTRTVMSTYNFRTRSHRWIWIARRKKIELRLIAHMVPFPVLRHQVGNNTIVTINSNNAEWERGSCITILPCCTPSKASHTSEWTTEEFLRWSTEGPRRRTLSLGKAQLGTFSFLLGTCTIIPDRSDRVDSKRTRMVHAEQGGTTTKGVTSDLTKSCTCKRSTPNQSIRQHYFQSTFVHTPRRSMLPLGKTEWNARHGEWEKHATGVNGCKHLVLLPCSTFTHRRT